MKKVFLLITYRSFPYSGCFRFPCKRSRRGSKRRNISSSVNVQVIDIDLIGWGREMEVKEREKNDEKYGSEIGIQGEGRERGGRVKKMFRKRKCLPDFCSFASSLRQKLGRQRK